MSSPAPTLSILVDWDNDGSFVGAYDAVTSDTAADPGLSVDGGMDIAQATHPPKIPAADWELVNGDRTYSGEDPASPLYQVMLPGRTVKITATRGTPVAYRRHVLYRSHTRYRGVEAYPVHQGVIDQINQDPKIGHQRVALSTLGAASKLRGKKVSVGFQENITTGQAMELLLDIAAWPEADRVLDPGDTTLAFWWVEDQDAWDAAMALVRSEGPCQFYEDTQGRLHFEARSYRSLTTRSTVSQVAFYDNPIDATANGGLWFTDLAYAPSWSTVVNRATYRIAARDSTPSSNQAIWEAGQDISMGSTDQPVVLIARPSDPFRNGVTPVLDTDYAVTGGSVSVTLSAFSGLVTTVTITVTSGSPTITGVTSNGIQLRGEPVAKLSDTSVVSTTDASESITRYGTRELDVSGWPEVSVATAQGVGNAWVTRRRTQRPQLTLTMRNVDVTHLQTLFDLEVSDRVSVTESNTGIAADFWVEAKHLNISGPLGQIIIATLALEKCVDVSGFAWDALTSLWDSALWGE